MGIDECSRERARKRPETFLLNFLQLRFGKLCRLTLRSFFLYLLVQFFGLGIVAGSLIRFRELHLSSRLAHRLGWVLNQLLVDVDRILTAVGVLVKRSQR